MDSFSGYKQINVCTLKRTGKWKKNSVFRKCTAALVGKQKRALPSYLVNASGEQLQLSSPSAPVNSVLRETFDKETQTFVLYYVELQNR